MIVWWLDLQLSGQSVPITTKVVSSNPDHGDVSVTYDRLVVFSGYSGFLIDLSCLVDNFKGPNSL